MKEFALSIRFGIACSGCLIGYFLLLSLFNLHTNIFYSLFNAIITGFAIYEAIKIYKLRKVSAFTYTNGTITGLLTGSIATIIFTIFFALYTTEINTEFLNDLSKVWFRDQKTSKGIVFFTVAIMGLSTTLVLTLTFMQLLKPSMSLKKHTH